MMFPSAELTSEIESVLIALDEARCSVHWALEQISLLLIEYCTSKKQIERS